MKTYKFQKIKNESLNMCYPWMFVAESPQQIIDHTEIYMNKEIEKGVINYFEADKSKSHLSNRYAKTVSDLMTINESTFFLESTKLENKIFAGKVNALLKHGRLYLRENGSYMVAGDDYSVISEIEAIKLVYPNDWSESDIKITQWPGGKHYYASIGNVDVVNSLGLRKWNTYKEAYRNAKVFLQSDMISLVSK